MNTDLILRQVRTLDHPLPVDVAIAYGKIIAIAARFDGTGEDIDGRGHTLIPGLIDHHMHIMASAAARESLDVSGLIQRDDVITAIRSFANMLPAGRAVRATGYDERAAGLPERAELDQWLPDRPLRMLDRTGALWMINGAMAARLGDGPNPYGVDLAKGHIWRQDVWLREQLGGEVPDIAALAHALASYGITGVTDTSPHNGPSEGALFDAAMADGRWPLRLQLMGREDLPMSRHYLRGPLKLHYDERDLPDLDAVATRISAARGQGRTVAAHCVSEAELLWFLTALDISGGAQAGDRVEHGGLIPADIIPQLRGLNVVSNPGFIQARGDRYAAEIGAADWPDLYRLNTLHAAGIAIAAGSDAPYGPLDPWVGMRAAIDRLTAQGKEIGLAEALSPDDALALYTWDFSLSRQRRVAVGEAADLCLLHGGYKRNLADHRAKGVLATIVGGHIVYGGV
jgi:predicted amidohydrolase YtcJ